jgi:hypothetical protein
MEEKHIWLTLDENNTDYRFLEMLCQKNINPGLVNI